MITSGELIPKIEILELDFDLQYEVWNPSTYEEERCKKGMHSALVRMIE